MTGIVAPRGIIRTDVYPEGSVRGQSKEGRPDRAKRDGLICGIFSDRNRTYRAPQGLGRKLSECIALAKAYEAKLGYAPVPDADFAGDVQAAIDAHREPLNPPSWD